MLAGTFIGAGLGFGLSSWWQFNHYVDTPMAHYGIVNSVIGGMFLAGFMDLLTHDKSMITWSAFIGTELGAWLTATTRAYPRTHSESSRRRAARS